MRSRCSAELDATQSPAGRRLTPIGGNLRQVYPAAQISRRLPPVMLSGPRLGPSSPRLRLAAPEEAVALPQLHLSPRYQVSLKKNPWFENELVH